MAEMMVYTRNDGLLEPRSDRATKWVSEQKPGSGIIINIVENQRSVKQNTLLNGWYYKQTCMELMSAGITLNCAPWTRDALHAAMQRVYLVRYEYELDGEFVQVYESTSSMSKKRFVKYIDEQILPFIREMWNLTINPPVSGYYRELERELKLRGKA